MSNSSRYIASLLHKTQLTEDSAIFNYICPIIGTYDDENGVFTDDQGKEYSAIDTEASLFDPQEYICGNIMSLEEAYTNYSINKNKSITDLMKKYSEIENNYYYLIGLTSDYMIPVLKHNFKAEIEDAYNQYFGSKDKEVEPRENFSFSLKINESDKYKLEDILIELKKELDKNIKNKKYSKKQLEILKKYFVSQQKNLENIVNSIDKKKEEKSQSKNKKMIDIEKIYKDITKSLVSQDEPARRMITEILRMELNQHNKYGILLNGNTGVGKTMLMELISKHLNRPFITIDTTQLTSPGYVGKNIEEYLWDLYVKCDKDVKKAENAVVFFDEIDKKGSEKNSDISGRAVLNQLLKFLDGTTYEAQSNVKTSLETVKINTKNMLIVAGGSFSDVYDQLRKGSIGFNSLAENKNVVPSNQDFVEIGLMPREIIGRLPVIIKMNDLDKEALYNVLKTSKVSPAKAQIEIFKALDVDLKFTDDAYKSMAYKADKLKEGARGLVGVVNEVTYKAFSVAHDNPHKYKSITITEETVKDNEQFNYELENVKQKRLVKETNK